MRAPRLALFLASALAGAAALAAVPPKALSGVSGGEWELSGLNGARAPVARCVANPLDFGAIAHANAKCTVTQLGEQGVTVRVNAQCGAAGFAQGTIKVITPRSLRVELSGIADGAPFAFVAQARRTGECKAKSERGH